MAPDRPASNQEHFTIEDHGSIVIVQPLSSEAWDWIDEHVFEQTWWGGGLVVEPRYVADLVAGMRQDLFNIEDEAGS